MHTGERLDLAVALNRSTGLVPLAALALDLLPPHIGAELRREVDPVVLRMAAGQDEDLRLRASALDTKRAGEGKRSCQNSGQRLVLRQFIKYHEPG